jgi:hypothetical protein
MMGGCADLGDAVSQSSAAPGDLAGVHERPIAGELHSISYAEAIGSGVQFGRAAAASIDDEVVFAGTLSEGDVRACGGPCHAFDVAFDVPARYADGWIDVRVFWDGQENPGFELSAETAQTRRGFDVHRAAIWSADEASVFVAGVGEFAGIARYRHAELVTLPAGPDMLPNLVTPTMTDLYVGDCLPEEQAEEEASRCLRLGNAVANMGDGPLEVHLSYPDGVLAAGGQGQFMQRIYSATGFRDVPASGAQIHPSHGHFHYVGLAHFQMFDYDENTGLRGDLVATGNKRGFCFLDWGDMENPEAPSEGQQRAESECLIPKVSEGWSMGITRGMYDYYWPELADQYVDIAGVPDGVYELISIADGAQTLVETDETDNASSLIIDLKGDRLELIEVRSLYDNPEGVPV